MMRAETRLARREKGIALLIALAAVILLGLFVLAIVHAIQGPMEMVGRLGGRQRDRIEAESKLERARALLMSDPLSEVDVPGVMAVWSGDDSCVVNIAASVGDLTIRETWAVTAPTRFVIFAESSVMLSPEARIDGAIHIARDGACDTDIIDTSVFLAARPRRITAGNIDGLRVAREIVEIIPEDSTVLLANIDIDQGMIFVRGNVRLTGTFKGKGDDHRPLLLATGDISCDAHGEPWEWQGVIGARGDCFLSGPVEFAGTVVGRTVTFFGSVTGRALRADQGDATVRPKIRTVGRREEQ